MWLNTLFNTLEKPVDIIRASFSVFKSWLPLLVVLTITTLVCDAVNPKQPAPPPAQPVDDSVTPPPPPVFQQSPSDPGMPTVVRVNLPKQENVSSFKAFGSYAVVHWLWFLVFLGAFVIQVLIKFNRAT